VTKLLGRIVDAFQFRSIAATADTGQILRPKIAKEERPKTPYGQNNYRTLGASDVRRVAASPLPFFMKNRLIVFERATGANARKTMIVGAGRRAQRYPTAVEFVLLFTPRLVGKSARVHPAARGIVPLLRNAFPQSAATMRWWIFLDDFAQSLSGKFRWDYKAFGA
jgi:hypothetical protein